MLSLSLHLSVIIAPITAPAHVHPCCHCCTGSHSCHATYSLSKPVCRIGFRRAFKDSMSPTSVFALQAGIQIRALAIFKALLVPELPVHLSLSLVCLNFKTTNRASALLVVCCQLACRLCISSTLLLLLIPLFTVFLASCTIGNERLLDTPKA